MAVMIIMLAGLSGLQAQRSGKPGFDRDSGKQEMMARHDPLAGIPGLTDEQKENIKALHVEHRKAVLPLENQLDEKMARLKTLTTAESIDFKQIDATVDEITGINNTMMKKRIRHGQEIRKILTDEQRIVFDSRVGKEIDRRRGPGHR